MDSWSHDDDDVSEDETKPRGLIRPNLRSNILVYNLLLINYFIILRLSVYHTILTNEYNIIINKPIKNLL